MADSPIKTEIMSQRVDKPKTTNQSKAVSDVSVNERDRLIAACYSFTVPRT